jgi:VanZ family protein
MYNETFDDNENFFIHFLLDIFLIYISNAYNASIWKAEQKIALSSRYGLHSVFQDYLTYRVFTVSQIIKNADSRLQIIELNCLEILTP